MKLNSQNPGVINWLASATAGPGGGNVIAAANLIELSNKIGPVVLFAHSAGVASTIFGRAGCTGGQGRRRTALEGGVNFLSDANRVRLDLKPALPATFAPARRGRHVHASPRAPSAPTSR